MQLSARYYFRRALSLPPHVVARKAVGFVRRNVRARYRRWYDLNRPTYGDAVSRSGALARFAPRLTVPTDAAWLASVVDVAEQVMRHRFDVLGSGWVHVRHGMQCAGVEGVRFDAVAGADAWTIEGEVNAANVAAARRVFDLIDPSYERIDWQLDVKSGYRWSAREWAGTIRYGTVRGADVKVPWELARLQHLGQLAVAHAAVIGGAIPGGAARAQRYVRELRNQILDFVASNPPRYGVNWTSAMDVGIRVANMLFAYDLFRAHGATFDAVFEAVLARTAADHARYVLQFLEWNDELRGNHYLANLAGLVYAAAYLPSTRETDGWLAFGIRELIAEVALQFNAEGSNFEGSTAYHRLSAEMVVYAAALVANVSQERLQRLARGEYDAPPIAGPETAAPPAVRQLKDGRLTVIPAWLPSLLERMARFSEACVKSPGRIVLFGDNDSGRFIKLHPCYEPLTAPEALARYANLDGAKLAVDGDRYWDENHQEPAQLTSAICGLTGASTGPAASHGAVEHALFRDFARDAMTAARDDDARVPQPVDRMPSPRAGEAHPPLPHERTSVYDAAPADESLLANVAFEAFPAFGLYVARSPRLFLAIRCGPVGQNGYGGHDHNDQLACELVIDGETRIADPGTYLYSPFPDIRNGYRSAAAHFTAWPGDGEPARLTDTLFALGDAHPAVCLLWENGRFVGEHAAAGIRTRREVVIERGRVVVRDSASAPYHASPLAVRYAPGYGVVTREVAAR